MTTAQDLLTPPGAVETPPKAEHGVKLTTNSVGGLKLYKPTFEETYINALFYGDSGVGKTRISGSSIMVPAMSPVLLWDFEGGTMSLADDYSDVEIVRIKTWDAVAKLYNALYDKNPFKTIILDSLTELQKFSMSQIMVDVVKKNEDRDPDVASMREWGKNGEQVRRLVRGLRDLNCNAIFTALAAEERDEHSGITRIRPALPGKLKGEVAGYVDIVGYMYKKEVRAAGNVDIKTLMLTQGTERQIAKDRSGKLPVIMEAPTMEMIHNYVKGQAA